MGCNEWDTVRGRFNGWEGPAQESPPLSNQPHLPKPQRLCKQVQRDGRLGVMGVGDAVETGEVIPAANPLLGVGVANKLQLSRAKVLPDEVLGLHERKSSAHGGWHGNIARQGLWDAASATKGLVKAFP